MNWCFTFAVVLALVVSGGGCEQQKGGEPSRVSKKPTVVSLVPGGTDLIVGMGAGDHLVGISNYDLDREETRGLPRVGDYQQMDWEQITVLRPEVMIVFMAPERMPAALRERAEKLGIRLVNVKTERLADVYRELEKLGELLGEPEKARGAAEKLRAKLEAVRKRAEGKPRPRTLIVREIAADGVVGRETFIDDVLEIAGGTNALALTGWPSIDRETLMASRPEVILHLLPGASEQVVAQAKRVWGEMEELPAVKNGRVHIVTEWYALQPGLKLAELAEGFEGMVRGE